MCPAATKQLVLFAHRGAGTGPLENTLEGFQLAVNHGFTAVEFDIMATADGEIVVHMIFGWGGFPGNSSITPCLKPLCCQN
ncbi:MAG: glycerophosphodiester phosphodiesterase [Limnobacter sp.]|nr:glycerophosphodiester phosphodiesterase [Limnobacter sp.]